MAGQMGQKGGKNKMSKIVECGMGFMDRKSLYISEQVNRKYSPSSGL
jgi:hypothetical protein